MHPGVTVLSGTLRQTFAWRGMDAEVNAFVKNCAGCKAKKQATAKKYGKLPYKTMELAPWFEIAVDYIELFGPKKFRAITIIDTTTKLLEMSNITTASSLQASQQVDRLWFCRYPRPVQCIFNQGSEVKKEFTELLDSYGIQAKPITTKNPAVNAIIERIHLVIGDKMRACDIDSEDEWSEFCSNVVFATRGSLHTTMRATPREMAFGRQMLFNIDRLGCYASAHHAARAARQCHRKRQPH